MTISHPHHFGSWPPLTPSAVALLNRCSRPLRHRGRRRQPTPATSGLPRCSPPSLEKGGKVWRNYRFGGTSGFFLLGTWSSLRLFLVHPVLIGGIGNGTIRIQYPKFTPLFQVKSHITTSPRRYRKANSNPQKMSGQFHLFQISVRVTVFHNFQELDEKTLVFFLLKTAAQPEKFWNRISGMLAPKQRIIEAHQNPISISNLCSHGAISLTNPCGLPFPHLLRRPPAQRRQTLQPADGSTKETGVGMVRLYLEDLEKATAFEASEGDLSMFRKESKRWKSDCFLPNVRESAHFFVSLVGACTPLQCLQDCWLPRFATMNSTAFHQSAYPKWIRAMIPVSRWVDASEKFTCLLTYPGIKNPSRSNLWTHQPHWPVAESETSRKKVQLEESGAQNLREKKTATRSNGCENFGGNIIFITLW